MPQLEIEFTKTWENLGITGDRFLNKDAIWPENEV